MRKWGSQWNEQAMNYLLNLGPASSFSQTLQQKCKGNSLVLGAGSEVSLVEGCPGIVVGINTSKDELQQIPASHCNLILADAQRLPFGDSLFDTIVSKSTLHHLDLESSMMECQRVLRKKGNVVLFEPGLLNFFALLGRKIFPTEIHVISERPFIPANLKATITSSNFEVIEEKYYFIFAHILPIMSKWLHFLAGAKLQKMFFNLDYLLCGTRLKQLCWIFIFVAQKGEKTQLGTETNLPLFWRAYRRQVEKSRSLLPHQLGKNTFILLAKLLKQWQNVKCLSS